MRYHIVVLQHLLCFNFKESELFGDWIERYPVLIGGLEYKESPQKLFTRFAKCLELTIRHEPNEAVLLRQFLG